MLKVNYAKELVPGDKSLSECNRYRRNQKIKVLYKAGKSDNEIAKILNLKPFVVAYWRRDNGFPANGLAEETKTKKKINKIINN
jgi:uncharacterized protein YjcR